MLQCIIKNRQTKDTDSNCMENDRQKQWINGSIHGIVYQISG